MPFINVKMAGPEPTKEQKQKLVEEMTDLITGQRAYEANSKAITTSDDMLSIVNSLKR